MKTMNMNQNQLFIIYLFISCCFLVSHSLHNSSTTSFLKTCLPDQASALLQLKQEFAHKKLSWSDNTCYPTMKFWKEETDCCSWDGVTCSVVTGHIISLDLSLSCLHAPLHSNSTLFNLRQLQRLDLSLNNFTFSSIPSQFGQLSRLTHLDLSSSFFSGNIPSKISWLTKLVSLDLSFNFIFLRPQKVDLITRIVKNMTNLKELRLNEVNMSLSVIPESLANLSSLETLSLIDCNLHGRFPKNIFHLPEIRDLDVSDNHNLIGFLPEFHSGSNLTSFSLSWTKFSGTLPKSIGNLKSLNVLNLDSCNFSGTLPSTLWNLSELTVLSLSDNIFNAIHQLPSTIGKLTKLTRLSLRSAQISGKVPFSLGNLTQLVLLDLSNNNLSGQIPYFVGDLKKLWYLDLSNNSFSGQIPYSLGNLSQLIYLGLSINYLNGVIPWSMFTIPSLDSVDLDYNQLSGPLNIPSSSKLSHLSISGNKFGGQIPKSISYLTNLKYLSLASNFFSGIVDWGIFSDMKGLGDLDLSYNKFSKFTNAHRMNSILPKLRYLTLASCNISEFPEFLKSRDEMRILDLSNNRIEGPIPNWLLNTATESLTLLNLSYNFISSWEQPPLILPWKNLVYLDLHSNKLQGSLLVPPLKISFFIISGNNMNGSIHPLFCKLIHLQVLDVSDNNLTGVIPPCLGKHATSSVLELRTLDLSNNQLQGKVPHSLVQCRKLEILNLGHNQISDTFPFWLRKLPDLQVLVLRSNKFYGPIWHPNKFSGFIKLRIIDLSFNEFSGNLPSEIFRNWNAMIEVSNLHNSSGLKYMGDSYYRDSVTVMNKGLEMELVKIITIFTSIDLSNNRFDGEIPTSIGNLQSLLVLNLSSNSFAGLIPSSFGNLKELESLDLSRNKLSGRIPEELRKLTFLEYLNLSQNHLTGPIPQGEQITTFPRSAFEGNWGLCGFPLAETCDQDSTETPTSEKEEESKFDFGWRVVAMGYGCGVVVGVVAGDVIISKWPNWFSKTFGVKLRRRRR